MRRIVLGLLIAAGCSRDLSIPARPAEPPPGSVTGKVVYAVPGRTERPAASGAAISVIGSSLGATTNLGGTFKIEGLELTEGLLLFTHDSDGDGVVDRQRVLQLADFGTGPKKSVDLGEVVLGENASVHGRVLRGDLGAARSGHTGTAVFVPEGPFSAFTNDDGSFTLPNLPEGPLQFYVFRSGYTPLALGTVTLRSGEDYAFRDVTIQPSTEPQVAGSLSGHLAFVPPTSDPGDTRVEALSTGASPLTGAVAADLGFRFSPIDPGLYTLVASRTGYVEARVPNVLVLPGKDATVALVTLTVQPVLPDGGQPPPPDAGVPDAGAPDSGVPDAGSPGDGGTGGPCVTNLQCPLTDWCDDGLCRRQCRGTGDCNNGRACDPATRTCVPSCIGGCDAGLTCEVATNLCRANCSATFPCTAGFKCDQSQCVPECLVKSDCGAHELCQAGQCRNDGTCSSDLDCPGDRLCLTGGCVTRPSGRADGGSGPFTCSGPCQCRADEWCSGGLCQPAQLPTLYFSSDGGGDGRTSPSSTLFEAMLDAGPGERLALRAGDRFTAGEPFRITVSDVTVRGGYQDCGERWVRGERLRTTLEVDGGSVIKVAHPGALPLNNVKLSNLALETHPGGSSNCGEHQIYAYVAPSLDVRLIDGFFPANTCGGGVQALLYAQGSDFVTAEDIVVGPSQYTVTQLSAVYFYGSHGTVRRAAVGPQPVPLFGVDVVLVSSPGGPVTIVDTQLAQVTSTSTVEGVSVYSCAASPLRIEGSQLTWPRSNSGATFYGVNVTSCGNALVQNNVVDGAPSDGTVTSTGIGILTQSVAGTFSGNRVTLPASSNASSYYGLYLSGSIGPLDVRDNVVSGGSPVGTTLGIYLLNITSGPVRVLRNVVDVQKTTSGTGIAVSNVYASSALLIADNDVSITGNGFCDGSRVVALSLDGYTAGVVERNRLFATNASEPVAAQIGTYTNAVELYANHLWVGPNHCASQGSHALELNVSSNVFLRGNTLEAQGSANQPGNTAALVCTASATVIADSNVFGGGRATDHLMIIDGGTVSPGCSDPTAFTRNHFWFERAQPTAAPNDLVFELVAADAGTYDARGNIYEENRSCFDPVQPLRPDGGAEAPYRLAAGSKCVDRGALANRLDGTPVLFDLDGRPRDAGASPDIGCSEHP